MICGCRQTSGLEGSKDHFCATTTDDWEHPCRRLGLVSHTPSSSASHRNGRDSQVFPFSCGGSHTYMPNPSKELLIRQLFISNIKAMGKGHKHLYLGQGTVCPFSYMTESKNGKLIFIAFRPILSKVFSSITASSSIFR